LVIAYEDTISGALFNYTTIDQMYGDIGVLIYTGSTKIHNSNITNSYFKNGFFHWDENNREGGGYTINYVNFENNTSESGTIFNFPYLSPGSGNIGIYYSTFTNNTASKFGGVIFCGKNGNRMVFTNCIFNNNHAKLGKDVYCYTKTSSPSIRYGNFYEKDLVTLPSNFKLDEKTYNDPRSYSTSYSSKRMEWVLYQKFKTTSSIKQTLLLCCSRTKSIVLQELQNAD